MVKMRIRNKLNEAERDAKILRNINVDFIKKETPINPDEEIRDYFARIQNMERDPEYPNPVFPQGLVDWVESLPDNHFPRTGRKRFAKWLGNAIYYQETEVQGRLNSVDNPEELSIYNNDVRYITDYLNGSAETPSNLWDMSLNGMYDLAVQWHDTLKYKEDPTGDYENKDVVYKFDNGFTIVDVNTEHDLEIEGDKMGHCVGGYCDDVASGATVIYSLRDPKNRPHATIEIIPSLPLGRSRSRGSVEQIKGKGNAAPAEKYRPMIKQWLQTTDFSYKNSPDYLNILSDDELKNMLLSGDLDKRAETSIVRTTESPEILDFFLDQTSTDQGNRVIKLDVNDTVSGLARNKNLNEDQRLRLIKINFQADRPILGVQMSFLIGATGHSGNQHFDPSILSSRIWKDLGEELKSEPSDEKLYCMKALMELDVSSHSIKEEIVNHLLSDEYLAMAMEQPEFKINQQQQPYGATLQAYLFQKTPGREQVKRLYTVQKDSRFLRVLGLMGRLNGYIATSRGMSDELAEEIIKDVKLNSPRAFIQNNWIDMVMNPRISDSKKIELLNIGGKDRSIVGVTRPNEPTKQYPGLKWSISGKANSRRFVEAAKDKRFSKRFVKYMIDSGIFDCKYIMDWAGERTKQTGHRPSIETADENTKQKLMDLARNRALADYDKGLFDEGLFQEVNKYLNQNTIKQELNKMNNIQEEIKIYLKKRKRPFGNIEDVEPKDLILVEQWIEKIQQELSQEK